MFSEILVETSKLYLIPAVIEAIYAVTVLAVYAVRIALAIELDTPAFLTVAASFGAFDCSEVRSREVRFIELAC